MAADLIDLWYRRAVAGLFILGLMLPFAGFLLGDHQRVSGAEHRVMALLPSMPGEVADLERWPRELSAFFDDHFGYRQALLSSNRRLLELLGAHQGKRVIEGREGWFFYSVDRSIEDYRGQVLLDAAGLRHWQSDLGEKVSWLEKRDITYLFVIAPNKQTIYPEFLPAWLDGAGRRSFADQLMEQLGPVERAVLDLREPLLHGKRGPPLYFKLDTHWNTWGANLAQHEIMSRLAISLPDIEPHRFTPEDIVWKQRQGGDLTHMIGIENPHEPAPAIPKLKLHCPKAVHGPLRRGDRTHEDECESRHHVALVFHDSFVNHLRPFLSRQFQRTIYLWGRPDACALKEMVERYQPAVVIEERVERFLPSPQDFLCQK